MKKKAAVYMLGLAVLIVFFAIPVFSTPVLPGQVQPSHGIWDNLLKRHVKMGSVDYQGFARDVKQLDKYLDQLAKMDVTRLNKDEKLAYWINAYNAFTVKLILNRYPISSIRKISRPWKRKEWNASGKMVSLDQIEHDILRKQFKEPRIHFAIVCASIGCPDLQSFAYSPSKLEKQLAMAARQFFKSPKHFELEEDGDGVIIRISKIFSWFGKDFGANKQDRAQFMLPYLDAETAGKIKKASKIKFKYKSYDWALNEKR